MGNTFQPEPRRRMSVSRLALQTAEPQCRRQSLHVVAALLVLCIVSTVGRAEDPADEQRFRPPPPIDTELSRTKDVSIIRIEESDEDDDIWDNHHGYWKHEQRDHRFGRLRVKDESLLQLLCGECRISPLRVFGGNRLPEGRYNVVIKGLPKTGSRAYAADQLSRALETSFDIKIVREVREIPVLTLMPLKEAAGNIGKKLENRKDDDHSQSVSTSSDGDGVTEVEYQGTLASFVEYLEDEIGEAVVNVIELSGQVTLKFDHETVPDVDDSDYDYYTAETLIELRRRRLEDIDRSLRKYGLTLCRTQQRVKGIFITPQRSQRSDETAQPIKQVAGTDADVVE
ncbi:hypothetical protein CA54_52110 [Symmachiella macrocystis]|uniref:Uncharacterized protein n=2 Tax=Symmachiella macrocystis TaxID=2527985 RepID=A0A5C6B5G4_9PLAN|nr:hypothetical protein CA54_52110 [Symmachiella macrocystis]